MRTFGEAPPEEPAFFERLKEGLAKSSAGLTGSLDRASSPRRSSTPRPWPELEEALIRADMGAAAGQAPGRGGGQGPL